MAEAPRRALAVAEGVNTLQLAADIADKLQLLDYEAGFCAARPFQPVSRVFFAVAGKPSEQFPYFSALVLWLLRDKVGARFEEWDTFDDPNSVSAAIVTELRKLGLAADFPVSKLRHGSGDAVCLTLDFCLTKALEAQRFQVGRPQYGAGAEDDGLDADADADVDEVEDEVDEEEDDDEVLEDDDEDEAGRMIGGLPGGPGGPGAGAAGAGAGAGAGGAGGPGEDDAMQEAIEANVDPAVWALEVASVAPRLKFRSQGNTKEWRLHIEQASKHNELMGETFPKAGATLEKVGADLRKAVDRVAAKERVINMEFESLGRDFRQKQSQLDSMQERYNSLSEHVAELTEELAAKTEAVETLKASMADRNNSMTDTSPVRKISSALAAVKKELADMELRIGVAMQSLLQHTVKASFGAGKASNHERSLAHMESIGRGESSARSRHY